MISALTSIALLSMVVTTTPVARAPLATAVASGQSARPLQSLQRMTFHGTTSMIRAGAGPVRDAATAAAAANASAKGPARFEVMRSKRGHTAADVKPAMRYRSFAAAAAPPSPPTVSDRRVVGTDPGFSGFPGLTHFDQRMAGTGVYAGTQFSLEPPDQALCVGNNFVIEAVNNALTVYRPNGLQIGPPVALSQFFGLAPEIVRSLGLYGPFISDPKCYFDRDTQRWFVTELEEDSNPSSGAASGRTATFVAISQTSDPTGSYNIFSFDTTDYGHPGCPCFGDQPLIGADANGFYITTNEFPIAGPGFNGAQVYAFSKLALALGIVPTVVHIDTGALPVPDPGFTWYSVQPATTPNTNRGRQQRNGTEYFLSALDPNNTGDDRIAAWALTGTATLFNPTPNVALQNVVIPSERYFPPSPATQKPGPTPLATSLGEKLEKIDTNDDRMNQVVYAAGRLWSGVNSEVTVNGVTSAGIAYFDVAPYFVGKNLGAHVVGQDYVAVAGENTFYPSIGVNANGTAVLACSLSGPGYYPSVVYVPINRRNEGVRLAGPGALPDDGFTAYAAYGGTGVARWGDYSAAVADERGAIWLASEYIPNTPRTLLANWGTFVAQVP